MANRSSSVSVSPAIRRVALSLRVLGWVSFWSQVVLGVISGVVLIFAGGSLRAPAPSPTTPNVPVAANPGTGAGLFFAFIGLVALAASIYWAFRYTRLARRLTAASSADRPTPAATVRILEIGLIINLVGLLVTVLGAQAIAGSLLLKSFEQGFVLFSGTALRFITPLDLLVVQSNTNAILAHLIGLASTLWLLRSINRKRA